MSGQREDPADATSIALFKMRLEPGSDNRVSGARILEFEKGWALSIVGAVGLRQPATAHYFKRAEDSYARSRCGVEGDARHMLGIGTFPRCRICQRSVDRDALIVSPARSET